MSWGTKKCKTCGIFKPLSEFPVSKRLGSKTRLGVHCTPCKYDLHLRWCARNTEKPFNPPEQKKCSTCKQFQPADHFHRSRNSPDGLAYVCRHCASIKNAEYRSTHPQKSRVKNLWTMYRLTPEAYDAMVQKQGGKCPLCNKGLRSARGKGFPPVDHDHVTGRIRGILCHKCNLWLGIFEQMEPGALKRLEGYLG